MATGQGIPRSLTAVSAFLFSVSFGFTLIALPLDIRRDLFLGVLDEARDIRASILGLDDWSSFHKTVQGAAWSNDWLQPTISDKGVGHALGARFLKDENSLTAYNKAVRVGYRLLEVDVWLARSGVLYCSHDEPAPNVPLESLTTLEQVFNQVEADNVFLIIDFKQDAAYLIPAIATLAKKLSVTDRVIFQIYHANDLLLVTSETSVEHRFGRPIITTYKSPHSSDHLARQVQRLGLAGLIVQRERVPQITKHISHTRIFSHPISNCEDLQHLPRGIAPFTNRELTCSAKP